VQAILREIPALTQSPAGFRQAAAVARAKVQAVELPALRARLGRQAREWIKAERTWAQNGRRYRELYERLGVA